LDGYDEIALIDREIVTSDLQGFVAKANHNKFILTSRPEKALTSFGDFEQFTIAPLRKNQAFELLRKYDKHGELSSLLIKKLQESDMSNIDEFLVNPLLVSLLFTAFQHKQAIPFKKYLFYRQVFDANFESHDLTKGDSYSHDKYSKLEIDDFHRLLRHIGFSSFKMQKIEFDKDELLGLIRESRVFCVGLSFSESDFLYDLIVTVPLFTQDGVYYRWAHKSLQEYFAAQFIFFDAKEKQTQIIRQIYQHKDIEKFENILDLYYDIDFKVFRNIILRDFLSEYKAFYESYLQHIDSEINISSLTLRKELCFLTFPQLFSIGTQKRAVDHTKLDVVLSKALKQSDSQRIRFSGIVLDYKKSQGVLCLHWEDPKIVILKVLARKKSSLVKFLNKPNKKRNNYKLNYIFEQAYDPILLTDKVDDGFNSPENFDCVNNILIYTNITGIFLDTDKAFRMLEEIIESMNNESEDRLAFL
jgi:hypothetical protein